MFLVAESFWGIWGITYWLRQTGWPELVAGPIFAMSFGCAKPHRNAAGFMLSLLSSSWHGARRIASDRGLFASLAFVWLIFCVFLSGIGAQYLVWAAPFILLLSPQFYAFFTAGSTLFLFFFYNTISGGQPWYCGMSNGKRDAEWLRGRSGRG